MDQEPLNLKERIKRLYQAGKNLLDKKYLVFLFFVIIATIFWILNALSKDYTTTLKYPVRYVNFPENKVLLGKLPNFLEIEVNAYGFTLLKYKYRLKTSFKPIVFNVKSLGLNNLRNSESIYYLLTRYEQNKVSSQLKNDLQLLGIYPDTIYFHLAEIVSKKVKVYPDINYTLDKQIILNGAVQINPDSITISGPQSIIDTIDSIGTKYTDFNILTEFTSKEIPLNEQDIVRYEKEEVTVSIPAEKFTEASIRKELQVRNIPDSLVLKTFPKVVDVSYIVALSDFEKISNNDFVLNVDYNETKTALGNKLKIHLESSPSESKKIKITPSHVEYIIEKR